MDNTRIAKDFERKLTPIERFFTRSPFSIVTMVARIKGDVSEEMLKDAVAKSQQRHALLRARIVDDKDHNQWFTTEGVGEIPIEIVHRESKDDWIKIHAQASSIPYDFETRPAIRFILVQSPEFSELIMLCHHIICDGMSLAYLAHDLMQHLGDPGHKVEMLPAPPPMDLDNLPGDISQSAIAKFFIKRMNRQWVADSLTFDNEDYVALANAYWENFTHAIIPVELSEAQTSALVARCRQENVTVNSALTAAFCGAQSLVEGEQPYHEKIVVAASLRDRLPRSPGLGMGMYAGGIELKFKYNPRQSFWENSRAFHKTIQPRYTNKNLFSDLLNWLYLDPTIFEAMNFKKLGRLVSPTSARYEKLSTFSKQKDVVWRILKRDNLESLETKHWGTAVTNLGRLDFPPTYGNLGLDRMIMQPGGGIPLANANLVLGAVTCSGKLSLALEYASGVVAADTMEEIKAKAMEFLPQASLFEPA